MHKVSMNIVYAGLTLQVINANGNEYTPLKPISDLFGFVWDRQRKKVTDTDFYRDYLGTCTIPMYGADGQKREQTCILLKRVSAYLMTISPEKVKAQGNTDGAQFLMDKLNEWADALHDYETLGVAVNQNLLKQQSIDLARINTAIRLAREKRQTIDTTARQELEGIQKLLHAQIGLPFQQELPQ